MTSKKVWYISKYALNSNQGGPSRQYLFSKYFSKKGFETCLISSNSNGFNYLKFNGDYKLFETLNFKHFILKGSQINLGFNFKRIWSWFLFEYRMLKFLKKKDISKNDIVIVSSLSILTFLSGIYLKRKYKMRLLVEVRDIWPLTLVEFKNLSKYNPIVIFLSIIEKLAYKYADVIVGTMGNLGEHLKSVYPGSENKFHYIPMGLDHSIFENYEFNTIEEKNNDFIVGYAGTIGLVNKVDLILEAAELLKDNKIIKFVILGNGVLKDFYVNKFSHLSNVEFLPKVNKNKVGQFLDKCDILLHPVEDKKIYQFGVSPNKWIDYMFSAKPVIVSYNGFKNIINEANCGEFIDTDNPKLLVDTIVKYSYKSKDELRQIGQNGKKYLEENLTYDILSDKYIRLFNNV